MKRAPERELSWQYGALTAASASQWGWKTVGSRSRRRWRQCRSKQNRGSVRNEHVGYSPLWHWSKGVLGKKSSWVTHTEPHRSLSTRFKVSGNGTRSVMVSARRRRPCATCLIGRGGWHGTRSSTVTTMHARSWDCSLILCTSGCNRERSLLILS